MQWCNETSDKVDKYRNMETYNINKIYNIIHQSSSCILTKISIYGLPVNNQCHIDQFIILSILTLMLHIFIFHL